MSHETIKGKIAFHCDFPKCLEGIETSQEDFREAVAEAKEEGWLFRRRDSGWKQFCGPTHETKDWMGQKQ